MYSTCTFCYAALGANQAIESFPVGRRIVFDTTRGRLWVLCTSCRAWNLAPLEDRWEAVEQAERAFRSSAARAATDNISIAVAADSTHLIRVGSAPVKELTMWRYGQRLVRRHRLAVGGAFISAAATTVLVLTGSYTAFLASAPGAFLLLQAPGPIVDLYRRRRIVARLRTPEGKLDIIRGRHVRRTHLLACPDSGWSLRVSGRDSDHTVRGDDALHVAARLLPHMNAEGGSRKAVAAAVDSWIVRPDAHEMFGDVARTGGQFKLLGRPRKLLREHSAPVLLALEIAAQAEVERVALEGELRELEHAWREAEAIAAIADDLLLPETVHAALDEQKTRAAPLAVSRQTPS